MCLQIKRGTSEVRSCVLLQRLTILLEHAAYCSVFTKETWSSSYKLLGYYLLTSNTMINY